MARAIFEYTKTVLKKVSFNVELFCKELEKAVIRLLPYEIQELKIWLARVYSKQTRTLCKFSYSKIKSRGAFMAPFLFFVVD